MPLNTGDVINQRYRIVKRIAQGGFGAIYRAWDLNLKRPCALKINLETTDEAQKQFKREATMLANLRHPNLARVTDYFIIPGQGQYLVMDFVEGEDLSDLIKQAGPLPEAQAIQWIDQVCDALTYLHSQHPPIIHRDIKPANIKINPQGQAILVDFGIAKTFDPTTVTTKGARAVTPGYSPPEQYGSEPTDARSDIYALGATLFTLLTGKVPIESVHVNLGNPQINPRSINPAISVATESRIMQAIQLRPENRYQTARQFQQSISDPVVAVPYPHPSIQPTLKPTPYPSPTQKTQGFPWKYIILGAAFVLLAILAATCGVYLSTIIFRENTPTPTIAFNTVTNTPPIITTEGTTLTSTLTETFPTEIITDPTTISETPTITPTPTDTPTPSQTPTPTNTLTPSYTPSPSNSPTPTRTPTPTRPFPPLPTGIAGYELAFSSNQGDQSNVWLFDVDGSNSPKKLSNPSGLERAWWPSFCGNMIAAEMGHPGDTHQDQWIYWINPSSDTNSIISGLPEVSDAEAVGVPRCSHDGRYLGYNVRKNGWRLKISDLSSNNLKIRFDPQAGYYTGYASWNIWNDEILYMNQAVEAKSYYIFKAGLSGSGQDISPTRTDTGETIERAMYPAISPDGTKVVFTCFVSSRIYRLCLADIGSTTAKVLVNDLGSKDYPVGSPTWTADGNWIYFSMKDGDDWDIFRISPSGSNLKNMTGSWSSSDEITPAVP